MYKNHKLLGIFLIVTLLTLALVGCENPPWESGMTIVLKVDAPKDGVTVHTPAVMVSGRVTGSESAGAKVNVNDAAATITGGTFSVETALTEGKNVINIVAASGQAKLTEKVTVTYVPAKQ